MIPLRDENPVRRIPFVTISIIALNIVVFLFLEPVFATGPQSEREQNRFFYCHAVVPYELIHRTNLVSAARAGVPAARDVVRDLQLSQDPACVRKGWLLSMIEAMFLHGGWLHLGGNMLFLWIFGNNVEDRLGRLRYLVFYLAAGVVATLTQIALFHSGNDAFVPELGASGAIAGVLGAYLLMFPRRRVLTLVVFFFITWAYLPAWMVLTFWFVLQLFSGVGALASRVHAGGGVAFWAHIGGFLFGALLAMAFFPKERFRVRPPPARPDLY